MIITKTPLRISFFGGGTDFPEFYETLGGAVLSSAIDKFIYVTVKNRFDDKIRVGYSKTELVSRPHLLEHDLIRECLQQAEVSKGIEIATMADIPSQGSGLGSSSAVTVGTLMALMTYKNKTVGDRWLAEKAVQIERGTLGRPIGIQDQYAVAFGGLHRYTFRGQGKHIAMRLSLPPNAFEELNKSLILYYTGVTRKSATILTEQKANIDQRYETLAQMRDMVGEAHNLLEQGQLYKFGLLLDQTWKLKKTLASKISNPEIDLMYKRGKEAGAVGGKVCGAGGGGFMLFFVEEMARPGFRQIMSQHYKELPFNLYPGGAKVVFNDG